MGYTRLTRTLRTTAMQTIPEYEIQIRIHH